MIKIRIHRFDPPKTNSSRTKYKRYYRCYVNRKTYYFKGLRKLTEFQWAASRVANQSALDLNVIYIDALCLYRRIWFYTPDQMIQEELTSKINSIERCFHHLGRPYHFNTGLGDFGGLDLVRIQLRKLLQMINQIIANRPDYVSKNQVTSMYRRLDLDQLAIDSFFQTYNAFLSI